MEDDRENCMMTIRVIYSLRQRVSEWHIMAAEIVWTFRIYGRKDEVLHKTYELSEKCVLLAYYAASGGDFFTDVSRLLIGPIFRDQESKEKLPLLAA